MTSSWVGWMCPFGAESGGNTEKPTVRFLEPLISGPICVGHADQFYVISAGGARRPPPGGPAPAPPPAPGRQRRCDGLLDMGSSLGLVEMLEHHPHGLDRSNRIHNPLTGVLGSRPVDRLRQRQGGG